MASFSPACLRAFALTRRFYACICLLALAASAQAQTAGPDTTVYSDPKYLFRLAYPAAWKRFQSGVPSTVLAVDNAAEVAARQTVSVRVYTLADSHYADSAEFVFQFLSVVEDGGGLSWLTDNHPLKEIHPDIVAVSYGETTVGGASALYIVSRYRGGQDGAEVPWQVMQYLTLRGNDVFEISCTASEASFEQQRQALTAIALTFAFE